MALPTSYNNVQEDYGGLPSYVLDRLNIGAPPATTIDFGYGPGVPAPVAAAPVAAAPTVSTADILGWFNANPGADDTLIATTMRDAGVTPTQLASALNVDVGDTTNRYNTALNINTGGLPVTTTPDTSVNTAAPASTTPITITDLYQQELGRPPESQAVVDEWKRQFGDTIEPTEVDQFKQSAQLELTNPVLTNLKGQILGQNTTGQWQGQGFGSAEKNAEDMAKILSGIGITDINDFGQITKQVPTYSYDQDGNATQTGTETVTTYGNKKTGQEVPSTYGERQTGNAWGGTFAGKGNTGYRVDMSSGKPVFYTTGASSSDIGAIQPLLTLASIIPSPLQPFAMGANALIAADQGNWAGAILSGLGAAGQFAGATMSQIDALANAGDFAGANALYESSLLAQNAGAINTARTVAGGLNALDQGNIAGVINSGLTLGGVSVPQTILTQLQTPQRVSKQPLSHRQKTARRSTRLKTC